MAKARRLTSESLVSRSDSRCAHDAGVPDGPAGELELGLRDSDPDERHCHLQDKTARVGPTLQDAGSWPTQLPGLSAKKRCAAPANDGLEGPRQIGLSHPRY
jgi:hypothetical protein